MNMKETWKILNTVINKKEKGSQYPTQFNDDDRKVTSNIDIANGLNRFFSNIVVQSIYRWTHHKLQQKVFLRIHYQKGLQNNILRIEENLDGRTSFFSAKSKMAAKNKMLTIIQ